MVSYAFYEIVVMTKIRCLDARRPECFEIKLNQVTVRLSNGNNHFN